MVNVHFGLVGDGSALRFRSTTTRSSVGGCNNLCCLSSTCSFYSGWPRIRWLLAALLVHVSDMWRMLLSDMMWRYGSTAVRSVVPVVFIFTVIQGSLACSSSQMRVTPALASIAVLTRDLAEVVTLRLFLVSFLAGSRPDEFATPTGCCVCRSAVVVPSPLRTFRQGFGLFSILYLGVLVMAVSLEARPYGQALLSLFSGRRLRRPRLAWVGLARWRACGCITAVLALTGDSLSAPHGGRAVRLRRHILGGETACCCMCVTLGILGQ